MSLFIDDVDGIDFDGVIGVVWLDQLWILEVASELLIGNLIDLWLILLRSAVAEWKFKGFKRMDLVASCKVTLGSLVFFNLFCIELVFPPKFFLPNLLYNLWMMEPTIIVIDRFVGHDIIDMSS